MMVNDPRGAYLEVAPGVELYYEEHGAGSPLVFAPGWTFTTEVFEHQVAHFARAIG
jgi:non-heme chloroperoxidase